MKNGKFTIVIENLEFSAILGILEKEREKEQPIVVNIKIDYENKENFIDYAKVAEIVEETIKTNKFLLIEDAIDELENILKTKYPQMEKLYLSIKKKEILKNALVGVEILRKY